MNDAQLPIWVHVDAGQQVAWFVPEGWGAFTLENGRYQFVSRKSFTQELAQPQAILLIPRETELRVRLQGLDSELGIDLAALDLTATLDFFPQALPESGKLTPALEQLLRGLGDQPRPHGTRLDAPFLAAHGALHEAASILLGEHGSAILEDDEVIDALPSKIAALASNVLRKHERGIEIARVTLHDMHPAMQELPLWRGDAEARFLGSYFPGLAMPRYAEALMSLGNTDAVKTELEELLRLLTFEGMASSSDLDRTARLIVEDETIEDVALSVESLLSRLRTRVLEGKPLGNVLSMPLPGRENEALVFARIPSGRKTLGKPMDVEGHPEEGPTCTVRMKSYLIGLTPVSHHLAWLMGVAGARPDSTLPITGGSWNIFAEHVARLGATLHLPSEAQWFAAVEPGRIATGLEWCQDRYSGDIYARPDDLIGPACVNTRDPHGRDLRSVRDGSMGIYWRTGKEPAQPIEGICWRLAIDLEEDTHDQ